MDYYSKYKKYKLKYLQIKKQLGGAFTYQYEDGWDAVQNRYTRWADFNSTDSGLIRTHQGPGILTLSSGLQINKSNMTQTGRNRVRRIRIKPVDDEANRILGMLRQYPSILNLDPSNRNFQYNLFDIFANDMINFMNISQGVPPDAYANLNLELYRAIIQLGIQLQNLTVNDIIGVIQAANQRELQVELQLERDFF
jgi:hypothetical protein